MAILIQTNGTRKEVFPAGEVFLIEEMHSMLGCFIVEPVFIEDGRIMWVNEQGKLGPHDHNFEATRLLQKSGGIPGDYIAGDALITAEHEVE